jgi:hypothetical protein
MKVLCVVFVVLGLLMAGCGNDDGMSTSVTTVASTMTVVPTTAGSTTTSRAALVTTTGASTTTLVPTATVPAEPDLGLAWLRVPQDERVFGSPSGQAMNGVAVGGPGLVAVGMDPSGGDFDAAVWASADGLVWSRVALDEAALGGVGDQQMYAVTAGGPGLVAVGWEFLGNPRAAVWSSVDGLVWFRVPHDDAVFGSAGGVGGPFMNAVVAGGPGLVAVGYEGMAAGYGGIDHGWGDAAVWVSVDGLTWSRIPNDEAAFEGGNMVEVAAGGPGLVAVGTDSSPTGEDQDAAVWTSRDGLVWSRVAPDEAVFGGDGYQEMYSVVAGGPGLVAVGWDGSWSVDENGNRAAAVWVSPPPD